jgi:hypothetical protein
MKYGGVMIERVEVPFRGEGAGTAALTWGQQHVWEAMSALGQTMNLCAVRELAPGAAVEEFVAELRYYTERFQSMRTRLRFDRDALPTQVVVDEGVTELRIFDTDDPAAAAAAEEATPFDYAREFPIRMTLLRRDGELTHLVTTLSHLYADAGAGFAMFTDRVGGAAGPVRTQLLDLAAAQQTPAARRQSDTALAYWAHHLRTLPARRFRPAAPTGGPRFWQLEVTSPRLYSDVHAFAARAGTDPGTGLLALWAIAVSRLLGTGQAVIQTLVSNRFRPGLAETVANISQAALVVVDLADATVDEAVTRTGRASRVAYKNAYFDFAQWKALVADVTRERGEPVDLSCYYNDLSAASTGPAGDPGPDVGPARWTELPFFNERLMLSIGPGAGAYELTVLADTDHVTRAEMAALLDDMHATAAAAALDGEAKTLL